MDLTALAIFLVGVAAGAFVLWGFAILKYGTKRELRLAGSASSSPSSPRSSTRSRPSGRPTDDAG